LAPDDGAGLIFEIRTIIIEDNLGRFAAPLLQYSGCLAIPEVALITAGRCPLILNRFQNTNFLLMGESEHA
jgi:hypothetical protein